MDIFKLILKKPRSPTIEKDLVEILYRPGLDSALKLLTLDYLFDNGLSIVNETFETGAIPAVKLFWWYSALVREVALHKDPWKAPWICTLFQIKEDGALIRITPATFLDEAFGTTIKFQSDVSGACLSHREFGNNLKRLLSERLRTRVLVDHISPNPYIHLASHESCHEVFANSRQLCNNRFNQRVQFQLLRIIILDNLYSVNRVDKFSTRISTQRYAPSLSIFCPSLSEADSHASP
jgi:hypothetical protein